MSDIQPLTEITVSAAGRTTRLLRLSTIAPAKLNLLLGLAQAVVADYSNGQIGALVADGSESSHSDVLEDLDRLMRTIWLAHGSEV